MKFVRKLSGKYPCTHYLCNIIDILITTTVPPKRIVCLLSYFGQTAWFTAISIETKSHHGIQKRDVHM